MKKYSVELTEFAE